MAKKSSINTKLNRLVDLIEEMSGQKFDIDVYMHDSYYVEIENPDKAVDEAYACCEPVETKDGWRYDIHLAGLQPEDLLLNSFAHELGHVIIEECEEVAADMIMTLLRSKV